MKTLAGKFRCLGAAIITGGLANLANAAPQDIDFGNCGDAQEHVLHATEGKPVDLRIRILNNEHGQVFWAFLSAPVASTGGASCSEKIPGASFDCAGVWVALPVGSPDKPVASDAAATLGGTPASPASFRFRLIVTAKGGRVATCDRSYLLKIGEANPDHEKPTDPAELSAVSLVPSTRIEVNLRWRASIDNVGVVGYLIERCEGQECTDFTSRTRTSTTVFRDRLVTEETEYRYRVRAIDAAGNTSGFSNIASERTQALGPPNPHPQ